MRVGVLDDIDEPSATPVGRMTCLPARSLGQLGHADVVRIPKETE